MKKIPLTKGKETLVDDDNYHLLSKYKWHLAKRNKTEYAETQFDGHHIQMHRLIMAVRKNKEIDHINGNGLDNQECNLRIVNRVWNGCNRGMNKNNTSGYKGVHYRKDRKKWTAKICFMRKWYILGQFKTAKKAAISYNKAAKKYHKEFAYINKI